MAVHLIYKSLPTVALRGMVVFPGMRLHFEVGREKSIHAIQTAVRETQKVFLPKRVRNAGKHISH